MIETDIVNEFFKRGYLLSPAAVEFLKGKNVDEFLSKKYDKLVLQPSDFAANNVKIVKNLTFIPEELTTETFLSFYNSKYEKMKKIFIERIGNEFVSINKIGGKRERVTVLGMVKNVKEKNGKNVIEIEDVTGSVSVIYGGNVDLDDMIAVRGVAAGKVIYADEVIYPDVPLRSPATGEGRVLLLSDLELAEAPQSKIDSLLDVLNGDYDYGIIVGNVGDFEKLKSILPDGKKFFIIPGPKDSKTYPSLPPKINFGVPLSNPSMININGVNILMVTNFNMNMLKKRYLGKSSLILNEDFLVLDVVPDIVVSNGQPNIKNYKSITIVNCGSMLDVERPVILDLKTREWNELKEM